MKNAIQELGYDGFMFSSYTKGNDIVLLERPQTILDTTYEQGGYIDQNTKDEIYKKWKSLVNMSSSELQKFYNSPEGKKAGLTAKKANELGIHNGRESARWIMRMKNTHVKNWTPSMWEWAKRQNSFVSRMKGNEGPLYDEYGNKTRKHTSLLIWGHNPEKYKD